MNFTLSLRQRVFFSARRHDYLRLFLTGGQAAGPLKTAAGSIVIKEDYTSQELKSLNATACEILRIDANNSNSLCLQHVLSSTRY